MKESRSFKKIRLEERILNEVNRIVRVNLSDARLKLVSITKVELSPDYSHAKVFWDTFNASKRGDSKTAITSASSKIRALLATELKMRTVPELHFEYDAQYDAEKAIADILDEEVRQGKSF